MLQLQRSTTHAASMQAHGHRQSGCHLITDQSLRIWQNGDCLHGHSTPKSCRRLTQSRYLTMAAEVEMRVTVDLDPFPNARDSPFLSWLL